MLKIGILTYHRAYNYGAFLQAYSLSKNLQESFPEMKIELINYFPLHEKIRYELKMPIWTLLNQGIKPMLKLLKKYRIFRREWKNFNESRWVIVSNKSKKLGKRIDKEYDIVIVGSDAVFNDYGFKGISPFYLYDVKKALKFSYAASAHGLIYTKNSSEKNIKLKQTFDEFQFLGLRDTHTEEFIKSISNNSNISHSCDPTVFLKVSKINVDFLSLQKKYDIKEKTYIVVMLKHERIAESIKIAFGNRYEIISLINHNRYADKSLLELTPFEWSTIISKSLFTISEYFHGILLSFRNGIPSICIDPMSNANEFNTKINDLVVERLNLGSLYFKYNEFDAVKDKILERGEMLISEDISENILKKMNVEAKTFDVFFENLSQHINKL